MCVLWLDISYPTATVYRKADGPFAQGESKALINATRNIAHIYVLCIFINNIPITVCVSVCESVCESVCMCVFGEEGGRGEESCSLRRCKGSRPVTHSDIRL